MERLQMPLVSVITPAFNAERWLQRLANSILDQTFTEWEWIVINDCSSDRTAALARSFAAKNARIRVLDLAKNGGVANARNMGLAVARGDYVCFVDADDYWHRSKLEVQLGQMLRTDMSLSCMDYQRVSEEGDALSVVVPPSVCTYADLLMSNHIGNLTAMVRHRDLEGLQFRTMGHEDYVFWLEVVRRVGRVTRVPSATPLCFYTVRATSLSADKVAAARWQWRIYRDVLGFNWVKSSWYFIGYTAHALFKRW